MASAYEHRQLSPNEIRIITVFRGHTANPLDCRIDHVGLQRDAKLSERGLVDRLAWPALNCNALSYGWGALGPTEDLPCHGKFIKITESLPLALKHIQSPEEDKTLLVDQICINQEHLEEHSSQVRIMDDIYRIATTVTLWLGDDPRGHIFAFKKLLTDTHLCEDKKPDVDSLLKENLPPERSSKWKTLNAVMALSYFTRVWVMLGVVLARQVVVAWGDIKFCLSYIHGLAHAAQVALICDTYQGSQIEINNVHRVVFRISITQERGFEDIIHRVVHRECKDKRDGVYGILSLINEGPDIQLNHYLPAPDILRDVILHIIASRQNLETLLSSMFHQDEETMIPPVWSTWVPHRDIAMPCPLITLGDKFQVCGSISSKLSTLKSHETSVDIRGYQIPSISSVGFVVCKKESDTAQKIWNAWRLAVAHAPVRVRYGSHSTQAFIWALLCGLPKLELGEGIRGLGRGGGSGGSESDKGDEALGLGEDGRGPRWDKGGESEPDKGYEELGSDEGDEDEEEDEDNGGSSEPYDEESESESDSEESESGSESYDEESESESSNEESESESESGSDDEESESLSNDKESDSDSDDKESESGSDDEESEPDGVMKNKIQMKMTM